MGEAERVRDDDRQQPRGRPLHPDAVEGHRQPRGGRPGARRDRHPPHPEEGPLLRLAAHPGTQGRPPAGPPGCGKTMIAKATAREAGARFINLDTAVLTDKWYGESQKLAAAVFSLAEKIQPCIIFIDEIDS